MKKVLCILVLCALVVTMFVGCGQSSNNGSTAATTAAAPSAAETQAPATTAANSGKAITISSFSHMSYPPKVDSFKAMGEAFKKSINNPNITFNVEDTDFNNFNSLVMTKFAANDAPDLIFGRPAERLDWIKAGQIQDVTSLVDYKNVDKANVDAASYQGKAYAAPLDLALRLVWYNKDIFSQNGITQIPKTRSEFVNICKTLKSKGIQPLVLGCKDVGCYSTHLFWAEWMGGPMSKDNNFFKDMMDRTRKFADVPAFKDALKRDADLLQYFQSDLFGMDYTTEETTFATGKCAMLVNGTWCISSVSGKNPNGNFGVFALPVDEDPNDTVMNAALDDTWMMSSQSKNKDVVAKFMSFMLTPEGSNIWVKGTGAVSAVKGVTEPGLPLTKVVSDYINNSGTKFFNVHSVPCFFGKFNDIYQTTLEQYAADKNRSADKYIKSLDDQFNQAAGK